MTHGNPFAGPSFTQPIQPQGTYEGHLTLNARTSVECPVVAQT